MNQWISDKAVFRTAPTTPAQLIILKYYLLKLLCFFLLRTISLIYLLILGMAGWGKRCNYFVKLDGVGPVDTKPSTNNLHHLCKKKKIKIKKLHVTRDTWHVTCNTWHGTCDTWHMTHDMWHVSHVPCHVSCVTCHMSHVMWQVWEDEHSLKISAPNFRNL